MGSPAGERAGSRLPPYDALHKRTHPEPTSSRPRDWFAPPLVPTPQICLAAPLRAGRRRGLGQAREPSSTRGIQGSGRGGLPRSPAKKPSPCARRDRRRRVAITAKVLALPPGEQVWTPRSWSPTAMAGRRTSRCAHSAVTPDRTRVMTSRRRGSTRSNWPNGRPSPGPGLGSPSGARCRGAMRWNCSARSPIWTRCMCRSGWDQVSAA